MENRIKIIIAGKHELACSLYDMLQKRNGINLGCVTCRSEDAANFERASLKRRLAEAHIQPLNTTYSHKQLFDVILDNKPTILISAGFDKIIKTDIINAMPCILNFHFGLLPKYRGSFSIPWAIINDEAHIGITLHHVAAGIDDGDIIFQEKIPNHPQRSCQEIYLEAVDVAKELLERFLVLQASGESVPQICQDEECATYYSPIFPNAYKITWKQTVKYVYNYIRACHFPPYSPAYTVFDGITVGVEYPVKYWITPPHHPSGTIVESNGKVWVTTLNGLIQPKNLIVDGEREFFQDFVIRHQAIGKRFD